MDQNRVSESDVVIIGAGSAGCVLAARLSEDPKHSVTVLEAGGSDLNLWVRMPIGYGGAFYHPKLNWRYYTEPDAGLKGRQSYWPRGKVVGGSSSINAMVFIRGQAADYDRWAEAGNKGWAYADLLPYFKKLETFQDGEDQYRGGLGPITVRRIDRDVHPLSHDYVASAVAAGHTKNPDFNGATQEGVGLYQINTRKGFRCSAATGYLLPALKRPNLTLTTHAQVTRILFEGTRATGVEYTQHGQTHRIMARRQVVLSAGSIGSPQILQLSGVGDPDRLRAAGVTPLHSAPQVGKNLQDHIGYELIYRSKVPTLNKTLGSWLGRALAGAQYVLTRGGPLSLSVNQGGGFVKSDPSRDRPNIQLYFSPMSYTRAVPGVRRLMKPDSFEGFQIGMSNCHPASRGEIHIRTADPAMAPEITPNYLSAPQDLEEMVASMALLRAIAAQRPIADAIEEELRPGPNVTTPDEIADYIRSTAGSIFHPCGTCSMGPDAATSVVGPDLKVHGLEGLTVADASIMPILPSGNINAPAMMIGEKAAELIAARI
ncbi:GMC family oxidoreductase [Pseudooceanicola sp. C21-150M6]|uniref:GMC family oxidoreductase n=1 Tax=Pseudooceanicola sp. C21-150M6 TaxID=3434355 RepID=UPI003D7F3485